MSSEINETIQRKKDHIQLTLNENVSFISKTAGFEKYEFEHYAITEVEYDKIDLSIKFLKNKISYPFLISCMTGGTIEAESLNAQLAEAANELQIPLGVGSQRQAMENDEFHNSYRIIREKAGNVPVLGNIGAAQVSGMKDFSPINKIIDLVEADAMVIHVNPLQELLQKEGETNFKGLLKNIERLADYISIPIIVKEVGAGISKSAAKKLLDCGVKGIDVAGAGGTSWAGIEILRSKKTSDNSFWDWGLPTTYCIREVKKLKKDYRFDLIGSGGITNGFDIAKAIALGADLTASARHVLVAAANKGTEGITTLLSEWFLTLKKIMYLTGAQNIRQLQKTKLLKKKV